MKTLNLPVSVFIFSFFMLSLTGCKPSKSNLELPSVFSDNIVLQQNTDVVIWGKARPGTEIKVSADWGSSSSATTAEDGNWQLKLATAKAGGPYNLSVVAPDTSIIIKNAMLGEVWLASGQSNMEMPLSGWPPNDTILHSAEVIANSENPEIRMFTVTRKTSAEPLDDVTGKWEVASPENAGHFSATAYFFAKKLNSELDVPVGIIHSSWGGTPIEAWISNRTLATDKDFADITEQLKQLAPQEKAYNEWLNTLESIAIVATEDNKEPFKNLDVFDDYCSHPGTDTESWKTMELPGYFEPTVGDLDGVIWFRKSFEIPAEWGGKKLIVSLGPIDDMDATYLNGEKIGSTEVPGHWNKERIYTVPPEKVKAGQAVLAVKVIDNQGGGGIYGKPELLTVYPENNKTEALSIAGEWKYKVTAQLEGDELFLFDPKTDVYENRPELSMSLSSHTPTALYNGMIAPLTPYTLQGSIWYQGETNVGRANQYLRLMELLITDWRQQFDNENMPFYYVQLAPWHYNDIEGISSANLREAQRRAMQIPHTGMAVTLDIGDINTIHPANKADVGKRLALWALANDYGKDIVYSGPLPEDVEIQNNKIIITFKHAEEGLIIEEDAPNQFEIAGEVGNFVSARVNISGNKLIVFSPELSSPSDVRYAYKNGAEASLFNDAGLPAPSFTTEENFED
jgi:sialate O-acetylesterase